MNIQLYDKTIASFRLIDGSSRLTFHGLGDKSITLPKGYTLTLEKVNKLYIALKSVKTQLN